MPVVTIRGQFGSGADEIGRLIAGRLGCDFVSREIIEEVAERLRRTPEEVRQKEEPPSSLGGRILEALSRAYVMGGTGFPAGVYMPAWTIPLEDTRYLEALRTVVRALAETPSIVIRGRGSQFILKDLPRAFHVLVVAPLDLRIQRVMELMDLDEEGARKEIDRQDGSRREFIRRYFDAEMQDPSHYDLALNTRRLSYEDAAELALNAISLGKTTGRGPA